MGIIECYVCEVTWKNEGPDRRDFCSEYCFKELYKRGENIDSDLYDITIKRIRRDVHARKSCI